MPRNIGVYFDECLSSDKKGGNLSEFSDVYEYSDLKTLLEILQNFYTNHSMYENNYRCHDNFLYTDMIFIDIDDGLPILKARKILKQMGFMFFILPSSSHQKDKNGIICDRYHVYIILSKQITDIGLYKFIWKWLVDKGDLKADKTSVTPSKTAAKHVRGIYCVEKGNKLDPDNFLKAYINWQKDERTKITNLDVQVSELKSDRTTIVSEYLKQAPVAEKDDGKSTSFAVACIIRRLGGTFEDFVKYNETRSSNPRSQSELEHKWKSAITNVKGFIPDEYIERIIRLRNDPVKSKFVKYIKPWNYGA